ncbi:transposase, partial [Candidatus Desantisbacteria bacterium]|nr:transposase [Candidatus Desantisbacteria bacterium]
MNLKFFSYLGKEVNKLVEFSGDINLDFTALPHWGDKSVLEKNWSGTRRHVLKSVLALIAQDAESKLLHYGNAEVKKKTAKNEILKFVDFWKNNNTSELKCLIFDSKFTILENLRKLDKDNIKFITIRSKNPALINEYTNNKKIKWITVKLDNVKRKYRDILVSDRNIIIEKYDPHKKIRQIVIKNHGREEPTFILTNDFESTAKQIITKDARRWIIET